MGGIRLLVGPVFTREVAIAPRRARNFVARASYVAGLLGIASTAWLVLAGTQVVRDVGDMARFGAVVFQILAPLQMALAVFFSALLAATAVAQEKDRRTLVLLLLTRLSNSELVLGKLLASLLNVLVFLGAAVPFFMLTLLWGGVSTAQVAGVCAVTLAAVLACGSLGSTLALWREKTVQALAMTVVVLVLWLLFWETVAEGGWGAEWLGISTRAWAGAFSPWRAILDASRPALAGDAAFGGLGAGVCRFVLAAAAIAAGLNGLAIARVRAWNRPREAQPAPREEEPGPAESIWGAEHDLARQTPATGPAPAPAPAPGPGPRPARTRPVWDNPIIWREVRTWAHGRRILVVRAAYLALFALAALGLHGVVTGGEPLTKTAVAASLVPLALLSLVLVNAQAVTSLTGERDLGALDLLLVTDLTPVEIVFGKLGGVLYNTKEMVLLPMGLCAYLWVSGGLSLENLAYLLGGLAALFAFVAVLGVHTGITYVNSRTAIATSLGTVFFLFVGVATCMMIMVAFSGSFQAQLAPFSAFMLGGGLGLYLVLGARNPSTAIGLASFACPVATFYGITSFFLGYTLGVFLVVAAAYGFATAAMLVPAISEFDVATGRTTAEE